MVQQVVAFEDVRRREAAIIKQRRIAAGIRGERVANEEPGTNVGADDLQTDPQDDLVGLALSGGGLRSAVFNLGLLQAFRKFGLLRYIDYLASVSGGGYTAGYLATVTQEEAPFDKASESSDGQGESVERNATAAKWGWLSNEDHNRFANCGEYLSKPAEFSAGYIVQSIAILALFGSGLFALGFLLAIAWRCFDYDEVRDRLAMIEWSVDAVTAFIPTVILAVFWVTLRFSTWLFDTMRLIEPKKTRRQLITIGTLTCALIVVACSMAVRTRIIAVGLGLALLLFWLVALDRGVRIRRHKADVATFLIMSIIGIPTVVFAIGQFLMTEIPAFYLSNILIVFALLIAGVSWWTLQTDRFSKIIFRCLLFSPLLGFILTVSNGSIGMSWLATMLGVDNEVTFQNNLREPLLIFVIICVLSLLRYRSLVQSRRPDAPLRERIALSVVLSGVIVGVPVLVFGFAARENISGFATHRDPKLLEEDIRDWKAFYDLVKDNAADPNGNKFILDAEKIPDELDDHWKAEIAFWGGEGWTRSQKYWYEKGGGWLERFGKSVSFFSPHFVQDAQEFRDTHDKLMKSMEKRLHSTNLTAFLANEIRVRALEDSKVDAENQFIEVNGWFEELVQNHPEKNLLSKLW